MKRITIILALLIIGACLASGAVIQVRKDTLGYQGLSSDSKPTTSAVRTGMEFYETDTGRIYRYDGSSWTIQQAVVTSALDTLTAPGNFKPVSTTGYSQVTFVFTDSLVATSATIQFRGKVAGLAPLDWFNLDADSDSLVLLGANGTWARTYNFIACVDSVRIKVVSEAGGVAGKFWAAVKMANPFK